MVRASPPSSRRARCPAATASGPDVFIPPASPRPHRGARLCPWGLRPSGVEPLASLPAGHEVPQGPAVFKDTYIPDTTVRCLLFTTGAATYSPSRRGTELCSPHPQCDKGQRLLLGLVTHPGKAGLHTSTSWDWCLNPASKPRRSLWDTLSSLICPWLITNA